MLTRHPLLSQLQVDLEALKRGDSLQQQQLGQGASGSGAAPLRSKPAGKRGQLQSAAPAPPAKRRAKSAAYHGARQAAAVAGGAAAAGGGAAAAAAGGSAVAMAGGSVPGGAGNRGSRQAGGIGSSHGGTEAVFDLPAIKGGAGGLASAELCTMRCSSKAAPLLYPW